jgi:hypothetical protein
VEIQMKTTASSNIMTAGNRHSKIVEKSLEAHGSQRSE